MNTIIAPLNSVRSRRPEAAPAVSFRQPHYDCTEVDDALRLAVYVPGVEASGVEITTQGTDLTVTARKSHFVRVNWQALHLENAQRDYRLNLRLGRGLAYESLHAELRDGVLTLLVPKKPSLTANAHPRGRSTRQAA